MKFKMASGTVLECNSACKKSEKIKENEHRKCKECEKLKEELLINKQEIESLQEIIKILRKECNIGDAEIWPSIAKDNAWRTQKAKSYRKRQQTPNNEKLGPINRIPVIVNRFALPSDYRLDSTEEAENLGLIQVTGRKTNPRTDRRNKVLIIGDSHSRGLAGNLKEKLDYNVSGVVKPNATSNEVIKTNIQDMSAKDVVVVCAGTNDIGKNCVEEGLKNVTKFAKENSQTNIVIIEAPRRYDLVEWSCVNKAVTEFNRKLAKYLKAQKHVKLLKVDQNREYFTRHGLHLNHLGKTKICEDLKECIKVIQQRRPAIPLDFNKEGNAEGEEQSQCCEST